MNIVNKFEMVQAVLPYMGSLRFIGSYTTVCAFKAGL